MDQDSATATASPGVLGRLNALADETRARLLLLLERSELTVSELCQIVQLPQSTVSRHLRVLSQDGWLTARAEGTSRHYRLSPVLDPGARRLWTAVREDLSRNPSAREDQVRARSVLEARAERSRAFFSSQAGQWHRHRRTLFGERAELHLLPGLLEGTEVVGDLGCGTGHLARLLAPFARRVIAVDRSPEMLELARERLRDWKNVKVERAELESLPMEDGALDIAILSLVLHNVVDPLRGLEEVRRTLRPGGRVLILDMQRHRRAALREEMGHLWLGFAPDELEGWLEEAGFGSTVLTEIPPEPDAKGPLLFTLRARRD